MAKIPQGEWNAIAARYAKGESLSKIAQSYSCTPPAIHYILKRSRQRREESQTIAERSVRLATGYYSPVGANSRGIRSFSSPRPAP